MKMFFRFFSRNWIIHIAVASALIAMPQAGQAQPGTQLDKHARKIEKRLTKYRPGAFLELDFRDNTEHLGSLGALYDASFQFTDADSNKTETHLYAEVARVKKGKEYIGQGSGREHHLRLWIPLAIAAVAAGAAVGAYEATH
jgi:hypothetical protein